MNVNQTTPSFTYSYYGRSGHTEVVCYWKQGCPSNQDGKNFKNTSSKKIYTHCERNDHTIEFCYRKHGYPLGNKFYNGKTPQTNFVYVQEGCIPNKD